MLRTLHSSSHLRVDVCRRFCVQFSTFVVGFLLLLLYLPTAILAVVAEKCMGAIISGGLEKSACNLLVRCIHVYGCLFMESMGYQLV